MQTSNPFRRKLVEEEHSRRSSLEGARPQLSGDEFTPTQAPLSLSNASSPMHTSLNTSLSPTSIRHPPPVSPRTSRRPLPPPPPPSRPRSRRVSPVVEPPPLPPPSDAASSTVDPFESASEDGEDSTVPEEEIPTSLPVPPVPRSPSTRPVPLNPFKKLNDDKRMSFDITKIRFGTRDSSNELGDVPKQPPRKSLDVDAFKRLILTGQIEPVDKSNVSTVPLVEEDSSRPVSIDLEQAISNSESASRAETPEPSVQKAIGGSIPEPLQQSATVPEAGNIGITDLPSVVANKVPESSSSSSRAKPPPPKPRVRSGVSSNSATSSSTHVSSPLVSLQMPHPITSLPSPSNVTPNSSEPKTSPLTEESPAIVNSPSNHLPKKPLPPSPPLSRRDSTRRPTLSPPATSLSRSNSTNRRPPPPPARRMQPNTTTSSDVAKPQTAVNTDSPLGSSQESVVSMSKALSPPPPPPRGTRRRALVASPSVELDSGTVIPQIPLPAPQTIEQVATGGSSTSLQFSTGLENGLVTGTGNEEDILADLENLQREVDALKNLVEQRNGVAL